MEYTVTPEGAVSKPADPETATAQAVIRERREGLHRRLLNGASGSEVVSSFTDLVDAVLIGRYRNVVRRQGTEAAVGMQHCCLVAVGGYGRRELAPYSDIDIMVLYHVRGEKVVSSLSAQVFHHLWDLGFQVGHSVRSIQDCFTVAEGDLSSRTALMESRFLAGSAAVFQEFQRRFFRRMLGRRTESFVKDKVGERNREYAKFGETIYLLEPNIKKTKGGLRDIHLLQWVGMARYQAATVQELANRGLLAHQDYLALVEAREFLWRVRALLHLEAGRAQEILTFEEQVRLAELYGFQNQPHLLAVEQFMQQYYQHTTGIYDRCVRFVDRSRRVSWWNGLATWWPSQLHDGYFRVSGGRLTIPADKLVRVLDDPEVLLRLFRLAQEQHLVIEGLIVEEIHRHMESVSDEVFRTPEVNRMFRQILSGPDSVAETLELMHQARILEKLVPAFARVRGLMQFNQYHKYTVDEHSLLAVREVERLGKGPGLFGQVYREIRHKDLLHLALLLHDVGKGLPEDHSEVGKVIAQGMAERLDLDMQEGHALEFLVHYHLLMSHVAFRRDPFDEKVILTFARAVGTPEILRKLFLLTAADIAAVGPDTLTRWKEALLIELYSRTLPEVSGGRESVGTSADVKRIATEVANLLPGFSSDGREADRNQGEWNLDWIERQLKQFSLRYLSGTTPERIAAHLQAVSRLESGSPIVESTFNQEWNVCEYTLVTLDDIRPGLFMNVTGVLAAKGLQVLDAQIITREDGIVVDTFYVCDPDFTGPPPAERLDSVGRTIRSVLRGETSVSDLMQGSRRVTFGRQLPLNQDPTEVQIDNETSDNFTIIDVFAHDRQGLLYVMARSLFNLGVSVHAARIATRLDQVVDVFYVTGSNGSKIEDSSACEEIRRTLQVDVDGFLTTGSS